MMSDNNEHSVQADKPSQQTEPILPAQPTQGTPSDSTSLWDSTHCEESGVYRVPSANELYRVPQSDTQSFASHNEPSRPEQADSTEFSAYHTPTYQQAMATSQATSSVTPSSNTAFSSPTPAHVPPFSSGLRDDPTYTSGQESRTNAAPAYSATPAYSAAQASGAPPNDPFNRGSWSTPQSQAGAYSGMSAPLQAQSNAKATKPKKAKSGPGWVAAIAMSAAAALIGGGIGMSGSSTLLPSTYTSQSSSTSVAPVVESTGEAPNWQAVQQAVGKSVVAIDTQMDRGSSAGSGVIIDAEGHILTNDHVISGAQSIYVTLADGRLFKAKLVGTDEATDLAVISLEDPPSDLSPATLGDSSTLHVGQDVAAIGNPLGLSSTMTTGIISALNRPVSTQRESQQTNPFDRESATNTQVVTNAIQLDAAVNPGNSGGPVFDSAGRVIGIASSIATMSSGGQSESGSIGLGFAIPINLAKNISDQLVANGVAEHAFLGVTISDGAATYDGVTRLGAKVETVSHSTPAAKAGIKEGDVIISIDGNDVGSATSLTGFVRQYKSGDVVKITLERDGELLDTNVTLATRQD